jgi:hypothetical protein
MSRFLARTVILGVFGLLLGPARVPAEPPAPIKVLDANALSDRIDEWIAAKYAEKGAKPAPPATDAEFIRRLSVDLDGQIPAITTVRDFLDDRREDKRRLWVNILLGETGGKKEAMKEAYVRHFSTYWRRLIFARVSDQQFAFNGGQTEPWFRRQIKDNVAYDQMVRELLAGQQGRFFFQANENKPEVIAGNVSRLFLGVRLECAQCHNDKSGGNWTRQQFWEFAAFFANAPGNRGGTPRIKIPDKDQTVEARFLDGGEPKWKAGVGPEVTLADWATSPKNPFFARAAVNRVWAYFLGTGLVDPVDAASAANPPSHPELLDELAAQFVAHKYDLKYLIRAITGSKTYQLSSVQTDPTQADPHLFARAAVRAMSAEQLFDSLVEALGPKDLGKEEPVGRRFPGMQPTGVRAEFLAKFSNTQEKPTAVQTSILQALYLMNNEAVGKLLANGSTLDTIAQNEAGGSERNIRELYEVTLSREPTPKEMERCVKYLQTGGAGKDRKQALADILWALVVSAEFVSNH